jgi:hypothetical protein
MRKYGLIQDKYDKRDFKMRTPWFGKLPAMVDLRPLVTPIEDQGEEGSCFGNGITTQIEMAEIKEGRPFVQLSRQFAYWIARDNKYADEGVAPRSGIKALAKWGVCREELWPYHPDNWNVKPSEEAFKDALNHRISNYYRVEGLRNMRYALYRGFPVGTGMMIFPSTEQGMISPGGMVPMPSQAEIGQGANGGHWVVDIYYNDPIDLFGFANSWGTSVGDRGLFYLKEEFVENFVWDCWVVER